MIPAYQDIGDRIHSRASPGNSAIILYRNFLQAFFVLKIDHLRRTTIMVWQIGFYAREKIDCTRFRELYHTKLYGLIEEGLTHKMEEHRLQCALCRAWIKLNASSLAEE